jgi:hypothetical protein
MSSVNQYQVELICSRGWQSHIYQWVENVHENMFAGSMVELLTTKKHKVDSVDLSQVSLSKFLVGAPSFEGALLTLYGSNDRSSSLIWHTIDAYIA